MLDLETLSVREMAQLKVLEGNIYNCLSERLVSRGEGHGEFYLPKDIGKEVVEELIKYCKRFQCYAYLESNGSNKDPYLIVNRKKMSFAKRWLIRHKWRN